MNKIYLKHGNVVELRSCDRYLYNGVSIQYSFINLNGKSYIGGCAYHNDLTNINNCHQLDIMKVYKDYTLKEVLWERKEIELTDDEKVILKNISRNYFLKWLVRNKDGSLFAYRKKPTKSKEAWTFECTMCNFPFDNLFQFIKWEDEEPYLIEDLLKGSD